MARRSRFRGKLGFIRMLNYMAFLPIAARAPTYGRLLAALVTDPRVPASHKAILGLAGAYLASPIDLIPEFVPVIGALDDVAVIVLALDVFLQGVPEDLLAENLTRLGIDRRELDADVERARKAVPRPIRAIAAKIPDAIEGLGSVIARSGLDGRLRGLVSEERAG